MKGGTSSIIEYFGDGVHSLSCTGMATVCNMGAETGATTSVFPYTEATGRYLDATGRSDLRQVVREWQHTLRADQGAEYDRIIEINLSKLEPFINGPSTPDLARPISEFEKELKQGQRSWPKTISAGLIGSCTSSSFEDISRAANLVQQALNVGLKPRAPLYQSPRIERTRTTLEQAGVLQVFEKAEATVLANACGPCCGSWNHKDMPNVYKPKALRSSVFDTGSGYRKLHRNFIQP